MSVCVVQASAREALRELPGASAHGVKFPPYFDTRDRSGVLSLLALLSIQIPSDTNSEILNQAKLI